MQRKSVTTALAIAGAITVAVALPGFAEDTGGNTNSRTGANAPGQTGTTAQTSGGTQSTPAKTMTKPGGMTTHQDDSAMKSRQSFDKTGRDTWAETQAKQSNGRISRQAYLNEMSRRWDAMDSGQRGLTPAEVGRLYGNVDSAAAPARTGSDVQAGNMGPEIRRRSEFFGQQNGRSRAAVLFRVHDWRVQRLRSS